LLSMVQKLIIPKEMTDQMAAQLKAAMGNE